MLTTKRAGQLSTATDPSTSATVAKLRQVLKRAGGVMHGRGSGRQVDVDRLKD